MASRPIGAGDELTVHDRTRQRPDALGQRVAQVAESPRDLAAYAYVVMSSLTDDAALADVMYGPRGALDAARSCAVSSI